MENINVWYNFALALSNNRIRLQSELQVAEQAIEELQLSVESSRDLLLKNIQEGGISRKQIEQHHRYLSNVAKNLLRRKRNLLNIAVKECCKGVKFLNKQVEKKTFDASSESFKSKRLIIQKILNYLNEHQMTQSWFKLEDKLFQMSEGLVKVLTTVAVKELRDGRTKQEGMSGELVYQWKLYNQF